ncbi:MAG: hypothetical protein U0Y82_12730 [Thermoleophilia bacterium]
MVTHIRFAQPSLRRRIEQTLAACPQGLGWRALSHELAMRAVAGGGAAPIRAEVVRELGQLIVEGRVDERQGRFVIRALAGPSHHEVRGQAA